MCDFKKIQYTHEILYSFSVPVVVIYKFSAIFYEVQPHARLKFTKGRIIIWIFSRYALTTDVNGKMIT